jgi:hypothetical protein
MSPAKVWVTEWWTGYESAEITGVFASEEAARAYIDSRRADPHWRAQDEANNSGIHGPFEVKS